MGNTLKTNERPRVSHVEWYCTDLERTRQFFTTLFNWQFSAFSSNYYLYTPAEGTCVGLMKVKRATPSPHCQVFIQIEDINFTIEKAKTLSATVSQQIKYIPDYGCYAVLSDFDGNQIGLFSDNTHAN